MEEDIQITPTLSTPQAKLVRDNVDLAHYLARIQWNKSKNNLDLEEMVSIAYQGLCTAALRWSPEKFDYSPEDIASGKGFSAFARHRILGSILDWQKSSDHVKRSHRSVYKQLVAAGYGQVPISEEALSLATGETTAKIREVIAAVEATPLSIDAESEWETPVSENDVESSALVSSLTATLADTYWNLPDLQKQIIAMRYYQNREMIAIAAELGRTVEVVREAHFSAVHTLNEAMKQNIQDN